MASTRTASDAALNLMQSMNPTTLAAGALAAAAVGAVTAGVIIYKKVEAAIAQERWESAKKDMILLDTYLGPGKIRTPGTGTILPLPPAMKLGATANDSSEWSHLTDEEFDMLGEVLPPDGVRELKIYRREVQNALRLLKKFYKIYPNKDEVKDTTRPIISYFGRIINEYCLRFLGYGPDIAYLKQISLALSAYANKFGDQDDASMHRDALQAVYHYLQVALEKLEDHQRSLTLTDNLNNMMELADSYGEQLLRKFIQCISPRDNWELARYVPIDLIAFKGLLQHEATRSSLLGFRIRTYDEIKLTTSLFGIWASQMSRTFLQDPARDNYHYELAPLTADTTKLEKQTLYIHLTMSGELQYAVINPVGEPVRNSITQPQLAMLMRPHSWKELYPFTDLKQLEQFLPKIFDTLFNRGEILPASPAMDPEKQFELIDLDRLNALRNRKIKIIKTAADEEQERLEDAKLEAWETELAALTKVFDECDNIFTRELNSVTQNIETDFRNIAKIDDQHKRETRIIERAKVYAQLAKLINNVVLLKFLANELNDTNCKVGEIYLSNPSHFGFLFTALDSLCQSIKGGANQFSQQIRNLLKENNYYFQESHIQVFTAELLSMLDEMRNAINATASNINSYREESTTKDPSLPTFDSVKRKAYFYSFQIANTLRIPFAEISANGVCTNHHVHSSHHHSDKPPHHSEPNTSSHSSNSAVSALAVASSAATHHVNAASNVPADGAAPEASHHSSHSHHALPAVNDAGATRKTFENLGKITGKIADTLLKILAEDFPANAPEDQQKSFRVATDAVRLKFNDLAIKSFDLLRDNPSGLLNFRANNTLDLGLELSEMALNYLLQNKQERADNAKSFSASIETLLAKPRYRFLDQHTNDASKAAASLFGPGIFSPDSRKIATHIAEACRGLATVMHQLAPKPAVAVAGVSRG